MQIERIPESWAISSLSVKVLRTGQDITLRDSKYVKVFRLAEFSFLLAYRFYFTETYMEIQCDEEKGKVKVGVLNYLQNPIQQTTCNIYLAGRKVFESVDERSIGSQATFQIAELLQPPIPPKPRRAAREGPLKRIVHVDTFGVQCGIATYLENLMHPLVGLDQEIEHIVFAEQVPPGDTRETSGKGYRGNQPTMERNWIRKMYPHKQLLDDLEKYNPDILHIQHEWSFFPASSPALPEILRFSWAKETANIVTWHTVYGKDEHDKRSLENFYDQVKSVIDMHIVHDINSYNNLLSYNVNPEKVRLIPMSAYPVKDIAKEEARRKMLPEKYWEKTIIVTGGFLLPNKGIEKIILAMASLNRSDMVLVCIGGSHPWSVTVYQEYHNLVIRTARQTGVDLYLDYRFMDDEEIAWYMACADINVLYYGWTLSGTSGWSRRAIASKRPIICTDVRLMSDLQDQVHCLKVSPRNIAALCDALKRLIEDKDDLAEKLAVNAAKYAEEISHEKTAKKILELYEEVHQRNVGA